jgi:hypothetical protein
LSGRLPQKNPQIAKKAWILDTGITPANKLDMSGGVVRISLYYVSSFRPIAVCAILTFTPYSRAVHVLQGAYGQWSVIQAKNRADADAGVEVKN